MLPETLDPSSYIIERPTHSVLIVRVLSKPYRGRNLPDATFTFRLGEPQYEIWEQRYYEQQRLEQQRFARDLGTQRDGFRYPDFE